MFEFEDDFEYLDDYHSTGVDLDDFTINRDTDCPKFCYSGSDKCCGFSTSHWGTLCRSGKAQSPINLPLCKTTQGAGSPPSPPLSIDGDLYKGKFSLTNDGTAAVLHFLDTKTVNISGAGTYVLDHLRFHWAANEASGGGSEHCFKRVSGGGCARETMELQLIHYRADKKDFQSAVESGQRHAVLAISMLLRAPSGGGKSSSEDDANNPLLPVLNPVVKHLEEILNYGESATVKHTFDLTSWFSVPNQVASYFGSLTVPMCKQVVRWYVLQTPMPIKAQDVAPFRMLKQANGQPLLENRRPMQKRNKREVMCYQLKFKNIPATAEVRNPFMDFNTNFNF